MTTISLGTVFWKHDESGGHFYVVITPPSFPEVLVVNFTSNDMPFKDKACIIPAGMHECLTRESVVAFERAFVVATTDLQRMMDIGVLHPRDRAGPDLMHLIWDGAYATRRMSIRCVELLTATIPN